MIAWDDIVRDVTDNISTLDKPTLERYLKIQPPQFNNPGLVAQAQDVRQQIIRRIDKLNMIEKESMIPNQTTNPSRNIIQVEKWYQKPIGIVWLAAIGAVLALLIVYLIRNHLGISL